MEELPAITPINFFQLALSCHYLEGKGSFPRIKDIRKYALPDTTLLCNEEAFASVAMGWNEDGLEFLFQVDRPYLISYYPNISRGDAVEIFLDTRNIKTSGYNTRFCHHFFFLPEAVEDHQAGELTHFRTEDAHEHCSPRDLLVKSTFKKTSYTLHCFIPKQCLAGFDPAQFQQLGFAYRIHRSGGSPQHLSAISSDFQLEQQPSLWSYLELCR